MSEILRILQVEDTESDAALIVRHLEKSGYTVQSVRVEDTEQMRHALVHHEWDVVIADYQLPRFDAAKALQIRNECARSTPFIVVSGTIGEDRAVEMMRAGAQDYVLKDRIARLGPAVRREVDETRARDQRRREHRQVEDRLKDRDEWLTLAVGATQLGMFNYYPQTGELTLSETAHRHLGMPTEACASLEVVKESLHPDDLEQIQEIVQKAFNSAGDGGYIADFRAIGLDDQVERWLTAQGRVFFDPEGKPERCVGVTMDITQRKQLEEQFRQTKKLEGIGLLAGGIAHDFNNLLTIISGFSQMTLDELPSNDPSRANMEQVVSAASRAADLTRQLLTFSRRQPVQTEVIVLNRLVASIEKMLGRVIGEHVHLALSTDPRVGAIRANPGHVEQVIINLVLNARDAMPFGGKLTIETASLSVDQSVAGAPVDLSPGQYATIAVIDTGTGMSAEVLSHLFEPFFTTKQPGKGTGLGLSTVYGIVKQCSGSITVSSELGRGTKFTVFLPTVEEDLAQSAAEGVAAIPRGAETILLAEDDTGVRSFIRKNLEQYGYQVLECANGMEALAQAQHHESQIHLLLSDVVMPELSGPELAARLANFRPGVPVLYMSGYNESNWPQTIVEETYLQKPFTSAALLTRVRATLDRMHSPALEGV